MFSLYRDSQNAMSDCWHISKIVSTLTVTKCLGVWLMGIRTSVTWAAVTVSLYIAVAGQFLEKSAGRSAPNLRFSLVIVWTLSPMLCLAGEWQEMTSVVRWWWEGAWRRHESRTRWSCVISGGAVRCLGWGWAREGMGSRAETGPPNKEMLCRKQLL